MKITVTLETHDLRVIAHPLRAMGSALAHIRPEEDIVVESANPHTADLGPLRTRTGRNLGTLSVTVHP